MTRYAGRLILAGVVVTAMADPAAAQSDKGLNVRVSIDHKDALALDVLQSLANSASLTLDLSGSDLQPVTVTLTNARVRTALDAVCENAGCRWSVADGTLKVVGAGARTAVSLKDDVTLVLKSALFEDAFRALASYMQVGVVFEGQLPVKTVTMHAKGSKTSTLLDGLCRAASCMWRFEPENQRLVVSVK